jgi:hypothetical protein
LTDCTQWTPVRQVGGVESAPATITSEIAASGIFASGIIAYEIVAAKSSPRKLSLQLATVAHAAKAPRDASQLAGW